MYEYSKFMMHGQKNIVRFSVQNVLYVQSYTEILALPLQALRRQANRFIFASAPETC